MSRTRRQNPLTNTRTRLGVEGLECRDLMAANVTATLAGGLLRVEGTEAADQIRVRVVADQIMVDGFPITVGGVASASVPAASVTRIRVDALGGAT